MYNNNGGQQGPSKGIRFSFLTASDQVKFEQIFSQTAASSGGNKVSASQVSEILKRSNLDNDSLAKIWDLASIANQPYLTFPEFAVAFFLTSKKLTGQQLPTSLPPNIREETEISMATIASTEPQEQLVNTSIQQQQYNPQLPMRTGMVQPQMPMRTGMPNNQLQNPMRPTMGPTIPPMQTNFMPQQTGFQQPMQTGFQQPMQTGFQSSMQTGYQQPMQTGFQQPMQTGFQSSMQPISKPRIQNFDFAKSMMPNQNGTINHLNPSLSNAERSWKFSPEDRARYKQIFNAWVASESGYMPADTAEEVFIRSNLDPKDLKKVWKLVDKKNRGSLDIDEFSSAMHLVYRKLNGVAIPNVLPSELEPPSSSLKKYVLGRHSPPSTPSFSPNQATLQDNEKSDEDDYRSDYVSNSRRKGPQSSSSIYYNNSRSRYDEDEDEVDVAVLEDLHRQIAATKRTLDRIPVPRNSNKNNSVSHKYSLEELKERIRRTQDDLNRALSNNPTSQKYIDNSAILMDSFEKQKSLQDELQYLVNRDIPILARQLRSSAAELRDAKIRNSRKNDSTLSFMDFIQPTGPDGHITESDRVRAKAKAMMASRKAGNSGSSTDAAHNLRRAEEEKIEADKKADSVEREMERSRTALGDMRGELEYMKNIAAEQNIEDKKRFEAGGSQDLSYELRRFIEQLNSQTVESSSYTSRQSSNFATSSTNSTKSTIAGSSTYQSSAVASPAAATSSPKPKPAPARPRTAEEIKKEAERRVQERMAALRAKKNPNASPNPIRKPDVALESAHDSESQAHTSNQTERENSEEKEREEAETARLQSENEEKRRQEEERDMEERRRQILEKEEAARQSRFEAIRKEEEEEERKKMESQRNKEHKPEEVNTAPVTSTPSPIDPIDVPTSLPAPSAPSVSQAPSAPPAPSPPPAPPAPTTDSTVTSPSANSKNPFAKFQQQPGSSQAEKPNEDPAVNTPTANKRVSYNPFAAFSAFSAVKGEQDEGDSEDDGWGHDDSEDESEFPAAGSAKNLAGMLFNAMSKRSGSSLDPVPEDSPKLDAASPPPAVSLDNNSDIPPPPPPPAPVVGSIPPPPPAPAPAAPAAPTASITPIAPAAGGNMRNALLSQIQSGTSLKKATTNDRSASSIAGQVIGNDNSDNYAAAPIPEVSVEAPQPVAPLSSGGFLAELQARAGTGSTASDTAFATPEPAFSEPVFPEPVANNTNNTAEVADVNNSGPAHDESLPEKEYVALWDYSGSGGDDLVFSQDDVILVRDNNDTEDWWYGTHEKSKKTGYFPRNYAQLKPEPVPELNIKAKALYDFTGPEGQGCLDFEADETLTILIKENNDWWKAQKEDGSVGLVPANYFE